MAKRHADGRIYLGLNGRVHCLDRADGRVVWTQRLASATYGFVTVVSDVDGVFAAGSNGEVWRLDPDTGAIVWHNELKGMGMGHATLALQRGDAYDLATAAVAAAAHAAAQREA